MSDVSSFILKQFTNALDVEETTDEGVVVEGIAAEYEGKMYVRINGSDLLTPITSSVVGIKDGDFVKVRIKNHQASAEGNVTTPSTGGGGEVPDEVLDRITELEIAIIGKADIKDLEAEQARIDDLYAKDVTITGDLEAANAKIENLEAQNVTITGDLEAANAKIDNLEATKLDAEIADIKYATIENLEATNANIHNLEADYGDFKELTSDKITANEAAIKRLDTEKLSAKEAELKYANIDFANIGSAAIENFLSKSGMIGDLVVGDGTVTGTLVGVTIKGDLIEGGTVVADKLVIKGEDGLYYKLNTDGETVGSEQTEYNSLNGSIITAKSVTAEKISVNDLVAFDATIGGFNITESSIYSGVKKSVDNTTRGIYMDDDGQFAIGDSNNYLKYFKMEDGTYKLALSVGGSSIDDAKVTDKKSGYLVDIGPNAGKPPIDVVVYGDTKQNLWQNPSGTSNGITVSVSDDKSLSISGTASANTYIFARTWALVPGHTYVFTVNKAASSNVNDVCFYAEFRNSQGANTTGSIYFGYGTNLKQVIKIPESNAYTFCGIRVMSGKTASANGIRVMLRDTTEDEIAAAQLTPGTLQEGGTADIPQDHPVTLPAYPDALAATSTFEWCKPGINGVEPRSLMTSNTNLLSQVSVESFIIEASRNIVANIGETGRVVKINLPENRIPSNPDLTFCAEWEPIDGGEQKVSFYYIDGDGVEQYFGPLTSGKAISIDRGLDITSVYVYVQNVDNKRYRVSNAILSIGQDKAFEAHSGSITSLDLNGNQLHMLPDGTRDELHIDDSGQVTLVQRVGEFKDFDSPSSSSAVGATGFYRLNYDSNVATYDYKANNAICDAMPFVFDQTSKFNHFFISGVNKQICFIVEGNNEEEAVAKLKSIAPTVFAELNTPQNINLDSVTMPALPADYAYAWAASDIPAYMDVTYWTVAGKDVSDKINDAQNSANDANDKIDEQLPNIEYARSQIEILNKSIATLVVDENGGSLMTQTSDGWKFNIGGIQSTLDDAVHGIQDVKGDVAGIEELANQTNALANDVANKTAYINMSKDETGAPVMELGQQGGEFKLRITNTSMDFMQGSQRIAYLSNRQLYIQSSVVTDEMKIGATAGYIWKKRENGNMGLRYVTK